MAAGFSLGCFSYSSMRSSPVKTATTPGCSLAAETSMDVILACAYGLRIKTACSIPGSLMLSVQVARPVTRAGSSLRSTPPPTNFSGAWVTLFPPLGRRVLGQLVRVLLDELDGLHDVLVAGATAQVPFQALSYLLLRRIGILLQQADGGHDHARRAVAALQAVRLVEGLLHRMPHAVLRNAPDGGDLVPVSLHRQYRARLDRLPVDVDRAGPATGRVASRMHAPYPEVLPEMME